MKKICAMTVAIGAGWLATLAQSQERPSEHVDPAMISAIREEGLSHAQVMDTISWLADVYGPRVTGSPGFSGRPTGPKRGWANGDWLTSTKNVGNSGKDGRWCDSARI